ncbi:MAG TPA: tRNA (cytidine(34)-2'-O)-methyltransferase [Longimicrobium sp.]|nr:tRNA (cytidine(34)-2'-O)-methyltransferase [Longimicrobium sp.]
MPDETSRTASILPLSDPIHVALFEPEIPGNAGNVARLCAASGSPLHLIGRLGFSFAHPKAKRAVMDYWNEVDLRRHVAWEDFAEAVADRTVWMLTTKAERTIWDAAFQPGDVLLLGPESRGLPDALLQAAPERCLRIPMVPAARSLNLGSSAGIALYEALRQAHGSAADG